VRSRNWGTWNCGSLSYSGSGNWNEYEGTCGVPDGSWDGYKWYTGARDTKNGNEPADILIAFASAQAWWWQDYVNHWVPHDLQELVDFPAEPVPPHE
jgi:hypothetical protein